jgi:hypothetical protein
MSVGIDDGIVGGIRVIGEYNCDWISATIHTANFSDKIEKYPIPI